MRFLKKMYKFKRAVLVVTLGVITLYSYAQEKKTYWDNGNLKSITNHDKDGKKTGYWETYYQSGELKEYGNYENDKKSGNWNEYYYNGERKKRTNYSNGLITEKNTYYENGRNMVSGNFDHNEKKHGVWEQYYNNWQQKLKGEYSHGKKHGQWKYYTDYGKLVKVENYKTGVRTSKWEGNLENNNEYATEEVVENAIEEVVEIAESDDSEVVEHISDPDVPTKSEVEAAGDAVDAVKDAADNAETVVESYYGNRLNGEWKFYNENGKCIERGHYTDDKKDGKWTYFYDNGKVKKEQLWKEGKLMEILSYFDKKGNPLDHGTLKFGSGTVKEYDADDKLISTIEYIYGEELKWNDSSFLNNLAWDVYENENDTEVLKSAIKWVKRSIELDKNYYNTDTYAALLYKTGKYKQALIYAEQAIKIAKKEDDKYDSTTKLIEQIYQKMKKY